MTQDAEKAVLGLLRYCRGEVWMGYDPYDGLSSPLARSPLLNNRLSRTVLTQIVKRSPLNLRGLLGIKKGFNPKGLALAARAIMLLAARARAVLPGDLFGDDEHRISALDATADSFETDLRFLLNKLAELRSSGYEQYCWGYNFDWQSRAFYAPRGTPNVVCTVFAAHAYLDWHNLTGNSEALAVAESSCRFLLDQVNRSEGSGGFCFSYTPLDRSRVHNVNMLAAELLSRAYEVTGKEEYGRAAEQAAIYSLARQRAEGSWPYGETGSQSWIDGFHTGFILVSLRRLIESLSKPEWVDRLTRGYSYYAERFFLADSTPRYYHDKLYPVDVHSAAQAIITFVEMTDLMSDADQMANRSVTWAISNLRDRSGFFYFQRHRFYTIKTPHMRWAQAWMLYALSRYLAKDSLITNV
jgi:hypothetical protein